MKWQLIETAPKNETVLLWEPPHRGTGGGCMFTGYWHEYHKLRCDATGNEKVFATHWQKLPAPPKVNQSC